MTTTPPAIECRRLTHRYGQFTAVHELDLQVSTGETVGLLGPNGAGKTTVIRVLTTLTPPCRRATSGSSGWTRDATPWTSASTSAMSRNNFPSKQR